MAAVEIINPYKGKTGAQLEALRLEKATELNAIFEAKTATAADGTKTYDLSVDELKDVQARHKELTDIGIERDKQIDTERIAEGAKSIYTDLSAPRRPQFPALVGSNGATADRKSIGQSFVESKQYMRMLESGAKESDEVSMDIGLKTLMTTTTGWVPEATRSGRIVDYAVRPIQVTDIIPTIQISQNAFIYMEETTFTNAAVETAEGAPKPEAALALTQRTSLVRKIAVWIPVTDEQLEDVPGIQSYIEQRLSFMVRQRLDSQILVGTGVAPNLYGIVPQAGQTQAKGADPTPDAVYKAMTKVRVTGRAMPDYFVVHPNDWQDIRLLRTLDGIYIWGSPMDAGPERIWGLPVVVTDGITEGTGLVGDFGNFSLLAERKQLTIKVGFQNDDFIRNQRSIVAEIRVALAVLRANAFATVTGI